ncbi:hypothetical protein [Aquiflexum sp.]|uniref:hypothetical protein n=1 Tax=Aquiflexum sp. TaxID=1872584 RepID=UPI0035939820
MKAMQRIMNTVADWVGAKFNNLTVRRKKLIVLILSILMGLYWISIVIKGEGI